MVKGGNLTYRRRVGGGSQFNSRGGAACYESLRPVGGDRLSALRFFTFDAAKVRRFRSGMAGVQWSLY